MSSSLLTPKDVADQLHTNPAVSTGLMMSGELPAFEIGGELRTTQSALEAWIEAKMRQGLVSNPHNTTMISVETKVNALPSLEQIKMAEWAQVAPIKYTARNGQMIDWKENAFAHTFEIEGKKVPIVIAVFGSKGGQYKGKYFPNWGAEVYLGEVGHGLQPINEWTRVDDFNDSRRIASVIKNGKSIVRPGEPVPYEYNQLELAVYNQVITRPYTKNGRCVVAHEFDKASLALHALIRCRQTGRI